MASKRNKYRDQPSQIKVNGERIPIDPKTNFAELNFCKAHWSWFHFLEHIQNIRGKWILKVTPKYPELVKLRKHDRVEIRMKYYSDDFSHLVDTEGMHKEILANYPFRFEFLCCSSIFLLNCSCKDALSNLRDNLFLVFFLLIPNILISFNGVDDGA